MKNPSTKVLNQALAMRAEDKPWAEVLAATGLNYSQAWLFCERTNLSEDMDLSEAFQTSPGSTVTAARAEGNSWGLIAVRCNVPESRVRSEFAKATGNKSQGIRIGKGGRFYYGDQDLYQDVLNPTGTLIPVGADHETARGCAADQRIMRLDMDELKNLAADLGIAIKGQTKVTLAKKIRAALAK